MNVLSEKIHLLEQSAPDPVVLSGIVDKLLANMADQYREKIAHYDSLIAEFEGRYGLSSPEFLDRFNTGELGDNMDYFEWEGLLKLRETAIGKLSALERAGV